MNLQLRAGEVLGTSFSIFFKNIIAFTILSAIVYLPILAYTVMLSSGELSLSKIQTWDWLLAGSRMTLDFIAAAAVTYGVVEQLRGNHAGIGKCLGVGLARLFPVLAVGLLVALCVLGGLFLLVIPGIIIMMMLSVAVPAAVVERPGIFGALKRSKELTDGHKGAIFVVFFVLGLIKMGITYGVQKTAMSNISSLDDIKIYMFVLLGVSIVMGALGAVASAVIYNNLRQIKDGVDLDEIAKVFE